MTYDYIIVGGGISGLYSAYRLLKSTAKNGAKNDAKKILILEKNESRWIGGRMGYYPFHGIDVSIGCGIGRKKKDKLLIALLHDLDVAYKEIHVTNQIADNIEYSADVSYIVSLLRHEFLSLDRSKVLTFKQFALPILGKKIYDTFLITSGYTDFENEDVYETLYYYGMDDNTSGWTGLSISWRTLLHALLKKLENKVEIKSSSHVTNVVEVSELVGKDSGSEFIVSLSSGQSYSCKNVILATTVDTVRKLLPKHKIYNDIIGQPFLRIYGKFSKECIPIMREHFSVGTMVKGAIHRIIPMNIDSGIYMIVYTDNKGALALKNHIDNNGKNREYFCRLIEKSCDLPAGSLFLTDMISFYWNIGTHYYKPLSIINGSNEDSNECSLETSRKEFIYKAQHPMPGMYVVGEMVSRNQGWVEGALESVDAVF